MSMAFNIIVLNVKFNLLKMASFQVTLPEKFGIKKPADFERLFMRFKSFKLQVVNQKHHRNNKLTPWFIVWARKLTMY